jgi:predicted nucleotidyltransferase
LFGSIATNDALSFLTSHRFSQLSLSERSPYKSGHHTKPLAVSLTPSQKMISSSNHGRVTSDSSESTGIGSLSLTTRFFAIAQSEFHEPVKAAVDELTERLDGVLGITLYGSVARGDADRPSDIDLWVLTQGDRAPNQREANAIARNFEEEAFNGNRYSYDVDVEAVQAVPTYTADIRDIVVSGIPVHQTEDFETVQTLLLEEGGSDE